MDSLLDSDSQSYSKLIRDNVRVEPLEKGGSGRKYYRLRVSPEQSVILVKYGSQREENRHYCEIAAFLDALGVRVPKIFHHDSDEGLIWMEDLGSVDLWSYRNESWNTRHALYRSAIEQLAILHTRGHIALRSEGHSSEVAPSLQAPFDTALYLWEQNYFFENCAARYFHLTPAVIDGACNRIRLQEIAETLAAIPRVLVHRDFQSQNIMLIDRRAYFIDFQGMRPGVAQYDLASLLYDPYVSLSSAEREALLSDYIILCADADVAMPSNFREIFDLCAMQRLMQALGAYGFLGLVKEKTHFLDHIPTALSSLREVVGRIEGLDGLRRLLDRMVV